MIQQQTVRSNSMIELVSLRVFPCLMPDQMATTIDTLTEAQGWSVEQHVDYNGCVIIIAAHEATDETFLLSGNEDRIDLARVYDDKFVLCGSFASIGSALDMLLQVTSIGQG